MTNDDYQQNDECDENGENMTESDDLKYLDNKPEGDKNNIDRCGDGIVLNEELYQKWRDKFSKAKSEDRKQIVDELLSEILPIFLDPDEKKHDNEYWNAVSKKARDNSNKQITSGTVRGRFVVKLWEDFRRDVIPLEKYETLNQFKIHLYALIFWAIREKWQNDQKKKDGVEVPWPKDKDGKEIAFPSEHDFVEASVQQEVAEQFSKLLFEYVTERDKNILMEHFFNDKTYPAIIKELKLDNFTPDTLGHYVRNLIGMLPANQTIRDFGSSNELQFKSLNKLYSEILETLTRRFGVIDTDIIQLLRDKFDINLVGFDLDEINLLENYARDCLSLNDFRTHLQ